MKKLTKTLALVLALCFALSLGAFASGEPSGEASGTASAFAQVDATHWAGGSLTIEAVEIAAEYIDYVDATLFGNVSKIVYDGGEIDVDSAKYVPILTVDGVQYDLYNAAGVTYTGDVVISLIEKAASANAGNSKFGDDAGSLIGSFYYIPAAYFDADGYEEASSITAMQGDAEIAAGAVKGLVFDSEGDYVSAIYINGADVEISDSSFRAFGRGGDDFTGQGAAVVSNGASNVTIDNCIFFTGGALRSAIWAGGSSEVNVVDTVIQSYNDEDLVAYSPDDNYATPMMQQVPFALGLTGNIRATLDCGKANIYFTDSLVSSNGWAVLSTDSGSGMLISTDTVAVVGEVVDAGAGDITATIAGNDYGVALGRVGEMSGYIAYCDGFTDYAYGGEWYAPDYLVIITGGTVTVGASDTGRFYGWSDRIGFMSHQTSASTLLDISESDFDVTDTFLMIKSKGGNGETINLTDVTLNLTGDNAWGNNILEVIDSDDLGGGPGATTFTVPYSTYDEYLTAASGGAGGVTTLNIKDSDLTGNIYDSVGSQTGSQTSFKNDSIAVNLDGATLTGIVSSAYGVHTDENGTALLGTITVDSYGREGTYDYLSIGRILSFAAPTVNNPVSLSLVNSTWNVTGLSYLASLTVDGASTVNGDVYQNGQKVALAAGTYEDVIIVPAGADLAAAIADAEAAIAAAAAAGIVPEDHSDLVANTDMGGMGGSGEASGESSEEPAAASNSYSANELGYKEYLKDWVAANPAVQANIDEFNAAIEAGEYDSFPLEMCFTDQWFGYAAMSFTEFVAAGGSAAIPEFDPNLAPDAEP